MERSDPFLVINFGNSFLKGSSFIFSKKRIRFLDFFKVPYNPHSENDIQNKIQDLILDLERKEKIIFYSAFIKIGNNIGLKRVKEMNFFRERFKKPISASEFGKMIRDCQRESFLEAKNIFHKERFILAKAEIKKVTIDHKLIENPIGLPGRMIFLRIANLYLPQKFYKILKKTFSELDIKISFLL